MACLATMELANVELGVRLGLYEILACAGPLNASELSTAAKIHERYGREWLEQQAAAGVTEVDDAAKPPSDRRLRCRTHAHALNPDPPRGLAWWR